MVHAWKVRRQRETYKRAAAVTSAMMVMAFVASLFVSGWFRGQAAIPEISCKNVMQLAPQYVAQELDGEVIVQINQHLKDCKGCRVRIHKAYPEFQMPADAVSVRQPAPASLAVITKN